MENKALIEAIIADYSNQRKHDKYSICYAIQHMDFHNPCATLFSLRYKRSELLEEFVRLINKPDNFSRLMSFTTVKAIAAKL